MLSLIFQRIPHFLESCYPQLILDRRVRWWTFSEMIGHPQRAPLSQQNCLLFPGAGSAARNRRSRLFPFCCWKEQSQGQSGAVLSEAAGPPERQGMSKPEVRELDAVSEAPGKKDPTSGQSSSSLFSESSSHTHLALHTFLDGFQVRKAHHFPQELRACVLSGRQPCFTRCRLLHVDYQGLRPSPTSHLSSGLPSASRV